MPSGAPCSSQSASTSSGSPAASAKSLKSKGCNVVAEGRSDPGLPGGGVQGYRVPRGARRPEPATDTRPASSGGGGAGDTWRSRGASEGGGRHFLVFPDPGLSPEL